MSALGPSWQKFLAHARQSLPMAPAGLFVSQRTGSHSAGISRIVLSVGSSVWYMVRNPHYTIAIDSVLLNSKTQNAFLSPVHAMFRHDCPLAVKPASTPSRPLPKQTWTDSLPIDMLLSAVSVLIVAQSSSESGGTYELFCIYRLVAAREGTYTSFNYVTVKRFSLLQVSTSWLSSQLCLSHMYKLGRKAMQCTFLKIRGWRQLIALCINVCLRTVRLFFFVIGWEISGRKPCCHILKLFPTILRR